MNTKNKKSLFPICFFICLLVLITNCTKEEKVVKKNLIPEVTTNEVLEISQTSATSGGIVKSDGGESITEQGICWNTYINPTISAYKATAETGTGSFTVKITGLTANTKYYVRAYATSSKGTGYGSNLSFTTLEKIAESSSVFNPNVNYGTMTDQEGNVYKTITIGTQTWMAENLRTKKYNDGTAIPNVTDRSEWTFLDSGAYCNYNNTSDVDTIVTYGRLYNWHAVYTNKLAPKGWHVPSNEEWSTLATQLGGEDIAGGKLKEIGTLHWTSPNAGATNETGFTALPGGMRMSNNGVFMGLGNDGYWWSSSMKDIDNIWCRRMNYSLSNISIFNNFYLRSAISVRCVKD